MFEDQEPEGRVLGGAPLFNPPGEEFQGWTKSHGFLENPSALHVRPFGVVGRFFEIK
jgi:hypothetical protein